MVTLKDFAEKYEGKKTLNIADLDRVNLEQVELEDREAENKDGVKFKYKVIMINNVDYRIPPTVIGDIKTLLETKSSIKAVKVIKKGTGKDGTKYTVVPLD